uniref:Uncharacterized protein n=1 Tax=Strix occidentalis caurina TaxID=311401 RepID=A0A8D0FRX8_STROC
RPRRAVPSGSSRAALTGAACRAPGSAMTRKTVATARMRSAPRSLTAPTTGCSPSCAPGEFRCAVGRCVPYPHRCDGRDDCGDFSDEHGCVCPPGHLQCPDAQCLPPSAVCDGHRDCADGTDEDFCPGEGPTGDLWPRCATASATAGTAGTRARRGVRRHCPPPCSLQLPTPRQVRDGGAVGPPDPPHGSLQPCPTAPVPCVPGAPCSARGGAGGAMGTAVPGTPQ